MTATHRPLRAKLIYNAIAGRPEESPQQLASILAERVQIDSSLNLDITGQRIAGEAGAGTESE